MSGVTFDQKVDGKLATIKVPLVGTRREVRFGRESGRAHKDVKTDGYQLSGVQTQRLIW